MVKYFDGSLRKVTRHFEIGVDQAQNMNLGTKTHPETKFVIFFTHGKTNILYQVHLLKLITFAIQLKLC